MRLGVFGGAFNPPHLGHLLCAQEALSAQRLDTVAFVPMGRAPHREIEQDPGGVTRAAMCELAIAGDERFTLSRLELDRAGPSYTSETLGALAEARPEAELVLILGADQAATLPQWHEPERVLRLATVACAERGEATRTDVLGRLEGLAPQERVRFFEMPRVDVSSTLVRRRVAAGRPIRYLVADPVREFIAARGLYRAPALVGER